MVKISVVMPVRNAEAYIENSIESVLRQSMEELELICVDDGSTDDSLAVMNRIAEKDQRIRILSYDSTRGAAKARKDGILMSRGKYLLFLDADDYLAFDACECLYQMMEQRHVDILHFSARVEDYGAGRTRTERMERFVAPYEGKLEGEQVFFACFEEKRYRFNLWNKCFRTQICQSAMQFMADGYFPKANDLYAYFLIAYFAKSYYGVVTKPFYHYCFGTGSTGNGKLTLEQFDVYCCEKDVADQLKAFASAQKNSIRLLQCVESLNQHFVQECLWNWKEYMDIESGAAGFEMLAQKWNPAELANTIALKYHGERQSVVEKMEGASCFQQNKKEVRTIGIFYYRMACGGVQRVISLQIPMFLKLGYKVVLFVEEENPDYEYDIPSDIEKVILPTSFEIEPKQYEAHGIALEAALKKYRIDLLIYHAGSADMLLYDLLITKLLGISFVIMLHEMFSQRMVSADSFVSLKPKVFRLADKLLVLSETEKLYWETLGVCAEYIPNPVDRIYLPEKNSEKEKSYILWIGRLAAQQKRYEDAVYVMKYVTERIPDARMRIVGSDYTANARQKLRRLIEKQHLATNIEVLEFQKDVAGLYEGAKIHLLTSAYEAFPMTIIESKSYGVPLVLYDLPYLELLKDKKGYISVPQEDRKAMAEAIISILTDEEKYRKLSEEAKESIQPFAETDYAGIWKKILIDIAEGRDKRTIQENDRVTTEEYRVILETMLFHYTKAAQKYAKLQERNWKLSEENEQLKKRVEYRMRKKAGKLKRCVMKWMRRI